VTAFAVFRLSVLIRHMSFKVTAVLATP
jgi:hypothetical protein